MELTFEQKFQLRAYESTIKAMPLKELQDITIDFIKQNIGATSPLRTEQ